MLAAAMIAVAATASRLADAWIWAGLGLALSVLAPIGYLLWLYQRGFMYQNLDVQRREERWRPLAFTLAVLALSATLFWLSPARRCSAGLAAAHFAQTTLVLAITLRWKISMHGAASSACVALLLYIVAPTLPWRCTRCGSSPGRASVCIATPPRRPFRGRPRWICYLEKTSITVWTAVISKTYSE